MTNLATCRYLLRNMFNLRRFALFLFFFLAVSSVQADGLYEVKNVTLVDGAVQCGKSGTPLLNDNFETSDQWTDFSNYRDLLSIEFGKEFNGEKGLLVSRVKPIDPADPEGKDTAWGVVTTKRPVGEIKKGSGYVLRLVSIASKKIEAGGMDGKSYRGALCWYDASDELIESVPFLFHSEGRLWENLISGSIPENAASFDVRIGFDVPNLLPDEYVFIKTILLELVDSTRPFVRPGEFVSEISNGGKISWDADIPEGCAVSFQVSTADRLDGNSDEPDEFSQFVGPDGSPNTYYTEPFEVDAPFVRYKAFLNPNGSASPSLKSVVVAGKTDSHWALGADVDPPRVKLVGKRATPTTEQNVPLEIEISDASVVRLSSVKIVFDEQEQDLASFTTTKNAAGAWILSKTPEGELSSGLHKVEIAVSDVHDNSVLATRYFLVGEPANVIDVTLRDDGMTLIDGVPFFPIGLYGVSEREFNGNNIDEAFRGLKEAGFNFAHSYSMPREDRFLAAAEKYGFKLWTVARFPDERFVEVERFSPAIVSWYLGDDTSYNTTPSELYDYFDSVKAVDPTRLTVQADPIDSLKEVSNYRPYVAGTDAFLPEIYPVHKDGEGSGDECVAQTVHDVKRCISDIADANDGPKSIWPIIQYFKGWGWQRFPTYRELRAMSFASIAAGAHGITWYTYGGTVEPENKKYNYGVTTTPERWRNISKIATQIKELSPALLERADSNAQPVVEIKNGPKVDVYGDESIVCLLKQSAGKTYLIAVNDTTEPVDVQFTFPTPQNFDKFEVLYDERDEAKPEVKDGVLSERFNGFDVRIYCW